MTLEAWGSRGRALARDWRVRLCAYLAIAVAAAWLHGPGSPPILPYVYGGF